MKFVGFCILTLLFMATHILYAESDTEIQYELRTLEYVQCAPTDTPFDFELFYNLSEKQGYIFQHSVRFKFRENLQLVSFDQLLEWNQRDANTFIPKQTQIVKFNSDPNGKWKTHQMIIDETTLHFIAKGNCDGASYAIREDISWLDLPYRKQLGGCELNIYTTPKREVYTYDIQYTPKDADADNFAVGFCITATWKDTLTLFNDYAYFNVFMERLLFKDMQKSLGGMLPLPPPTPMDAYTERYNESDTSLPIIDLCISFDPIKCKFVNFSTHFHKCNFWEQLIYNDTEVPWEKFPYEVEVIPGLKIKFELVEP